MELQHPEQLSPFVLLSIVNEKLRLTCDSLDQLEDEMEMSVQSIEEKLHKIQFHYQNMNNQFVHD
ncbi:DUF4250 domain-containing protein [Endozoicomonas ascidiicola]|uniref:DUF4250 domain-containing protein n=1 Tax=Endozoicomonas ascidiicola TaxID=1698521 RepID=UPI00082F5101|nr:DUF4250 domain-containing protein [Endozoicomonas ascidiicola]